MAKFTSGVLLVNLGTPDSPSTGDVRKYLREFLLDGRVIDIPAFFRFLLVNGIIAPFRAPKSAKEYQKLWDERGSPLKYYGEDIREMLQERMGNDFEVALAMRYQSPSIEQGLEQLRKKRVREIIVLPLFPQYASATSGSVHEKVMSLVSRWQVIPQMHFISAYVDEPLFIETIVQRGKEAMKGQDYDHVVFSYHGLPERQIRKASCEGYCKLGDCCNTFHSKNYYCYRAQCFETSRKVAKELGLKEENYTISFQSRLGKDPWIQPYTERVLENLAEQGIKNVLAFSPAFVADCLETTVEVGETFKEDFIEAGGEVWDLVPSLNDHPLWVDCLQKLIHQNSSWTQNEKSEAVMRES